MNVHRATLEQERKLATVLFADIAGSTALGEQLDIEPLGQIIGAFHRVASDAVERCGGVVEFAGDGAVAMFGAPIAIENHQGRAMEAADLILEGVRTLNRRLEHRHGVALGVRIGINTGDVLVDPSGEGSIGALAGDTFNVASRLQDLAGVGEVYAAERTLRVIHDREVDDLGRLHVPGRTMPVRAYRVGRAGTGPARAAFPVTLVGRRDEIDGLTRAFEAVRSSGTSRVVTIMAEAGLGKSTVLDGFLRNVVGPAGLPVAQAGFRPFTRAGALAPLSALVESMHLGDVAAIEGILGAESDRLALVLSQALGLVEAGTTEQTPGRATRELASAWRTLVGRLTSEEPWVFALEDIHWADPEVLRLLRHGAAADGRGLLLLATARPEPQLDPSDWPVGSAIDTVLVLRPLDAEEISEVAASVDESTVGDRPARDLLYRVTEGNPFFAIELVRSLAESDGGSGLAGLQTVGVPDRVQGVLAERIDRLERFDKRVLQSAAVIGRDFWLGAVEALLVDEDADVAGSLDLLTRRRMIEPTPGNATTYRFVHALTRDVAYGSIPRKYLHGMHETVAEWIERHPEECTGGDPAAMIAFHLSTACQSAEVDWEAESDHVDDVRRRWVDWALLAARRAIGAAAFTEAKRLAREAMEAAVDDRQRLGTLECLGDAHFYSYEGDGAWMYLTGAADLAHDTGLLSPTEVASIDIRALESPVRWPGGMVSVPAPVELDARIRRALALLEPGDSPDRVRLLTVVGFWPYATVGREGAELVTEVEAQAAAREAADMARRLGRVDLESAALDGLASSSISDGDYRTADQVIARRLDLYPALDDPWERGDLCAMGGWVAFQRARYAEAITWTTRGIAEYAGEFPSIGLHCHNWRGLARLRSGDWDGVIEDSRWVEAAADDGLPGSYVTPVVAAAALVHHLRGNDRDRDRLVTLLADYEALDPPEPGSPPGARWAEYLAPILARRGEVSRAVDLLDAPSHRRESRRAQLLVARSLVMVEIEDWAEAEATVERCFAEAESAGTPVLIPAARFAGGSVRLAHGDVADALKWFTDGVTESAAQGDLWLEGLCALGMARAAHAAGDGAAAVASATAAASSFAALRIRGEMAKAEELLRDG